MRMTRIRVLRSHVLLLALAAVPSLVSAQPKPVFRSRIFEILALILFSASALNAQLVERPLITGRHAVVTSDEPLASMAGMRILQEGGNAFDAAVATAVAVGVLDPRMSSIGGNGFATIYVGKTREVRALNFYGSAPKRATASLYQGKDYSHGFFPYRSLPVLKGTRHCTKRTASFLGRKFFSLPLSSQRMVS
jgi:gamma-glutamyltranspeptidase